MYFPSLFQQGRVGRDLLEHETAPECRVEQSNGSIRRVHGPKYVKVAGQREVFVRMRKCHCQFVFRSFSLVLLEHCDQFAQHLCDVCAIDLVDYENVGLRIRLHAQVLEQCLRSFGVSPVDGVRTAKFQSWKSSTGLASPAAFQCHWTSAPMGPRMTRGSRVRTHNRRQPRPPRGMTGFPSALQRCRLGSSLSGNAQYRSRGASAAHPAPSAPRYGSSRHRICRSRDWTSPRRLATRTAQSFRERASQSAVRSARSLTSRARTADPLVPL